MITRFYFGLGYSLLSLDLLGIPYHYHLSVIKVHQGVIHVLRGKATLFEKVDYIKYNMDVNINRIVRMLTLSVSIRVYAFINALLV